MEFATSSTKDSDPSSDDNATMASRRADDIPTTHHCTIDKHGTYSHRWIDQRERSLPTPSSGTPDDRRDDPNSPDDQVDKNRDHGVDPDGNEVHDPQNDPDPYDVPLHGDDLSLDLFPDEVSVCPLDVDPLHRDRQENDLHLVHDLRDAHLAIDRVNSDVYDYLKDDYQVGL